MKKPTIYLDTNIVSALHYDGTDINTLSRRMATRDWWEGEHEHFSIWVSSLTEIKLAQGVYRQQADCLRFVRRLKCTPQSNDSEEVRCLIHWSKNPAKPANNYSGSWVVWMAYVPSSKKWTESGSSGKRRESSHRAGERSARRRGLGRRRSPRFAREKAASSRFRWKPTSICTRRYVERNSVPGKFVPRMESWHWSSVWRFYQGVRTRGVCCPPGRSRGRVPGGSG